MLDAPVDVWYAWIGLAVAGTVTLGMVAGLPSSPPPDAASVARTVDTVAAADPPAAAQYRLGSDPGSVSARITTREISLRSDGGTASAEFASESIALVGRESRLAGVVLGDPPERTFGTHSAFADAVATAHSGSQRAEASWATGRTLHVRHVSWGETDVTLVLVT